MRILRMGFFRAGVLAAGAAATVFSTTGVANANVPPTLLVSDQACQALELTKVINGHDHMFIDPTVDNSSCYFMIVDANNGYTVYLSMSPEGNQPQPDGVYDGPGVRLWAEVSDGTGAGVDAIGPVN